MSQILNILTFPLRRERLIEASAGTGKTYTITGLYLRLLLGHGDADSGFGGATPLPLPVDKILVVTFTEAATEELRGRILARIREARRAFEAGESSDPLLADLLHAGGDRALATRLLLTAERQMDEAAIYTIHGFCQRMLKRNAFESGSLFETEFVSDDGRLRFEAVADFWRQHCYGLSLSLARAIRRHWPEPAALLQDLAPHLATPDLLCLEANSPQTSAGEPESWQQYHEAILQRIDEFKRQWRQAAPDLAALIVGSGVDKRSYSSKNLPNWLDQVGAWAQVPSEDYQLCDKLDRFSQTTLYEKTLKGTPPEHPLFVAVDELLAQTLDIRARVLVEALHEVRARIQQAKQRQQLLAFDDLLSGLALALDGPTGDLLAGRIRELYPVAMIDEFQDTDPQQYRIFSRLYVGQPSCGLYLIGDPKQAIYGFRGADIFTYIQAKSQVAAHYTLETNFRSTQALVDGVNGLFAQSPAPFVYHQAIPFEPVRAKGKSDGFTLGGQPVPPLPWCAPNGDEPMAAGAYRQRLAATCAAQIHHWLTCGGAQIGDEPLQPGDIAILVRTGSEAAAVRRALRQLGIGSVYLSNRDSVLTSQEAQDLLRLLEACLAPSDEVKVRSVMATALLGWSAAQLAALNLDELRWEALVEQFRDCARLWQRQGVLPMVRHFLFHHQIPARLLSEPEGERRLTDLLHVAELLQQAAATLPGEHALLRWLRDQLESPDGNADEQKLRLESERRLVQVVTIHKSKGLQYPLVLLPFIADWRPTQLARYHTDDGMIWDPNNGKEALARAEQERLAEDVRLLYVALTRGIYLTWLGIAELKNSKALCPSALRYLLCGAEAGGEATSLAARLTQLQAQIPGLACWPAPDWPQEIYQPPQRPSTALGVRQFSRTLERNWWVTSYSALSAQAVGSHKAPPAVTSAPAAVSGDAEVVGLDRFNFPRGARPGTFLHGLFEGLDFAIEPGPALNDWLDERLAGVTLATDWQAEPWRPVLQQWLLDVLAAKLQSGLALRDVPASRCLAEMEFLLPMAPLAAERLNGVLQRHDPLSRQAPPLHFSTLQGMLKGFMDLVFEHQGRFYVLDYKSNYLGDSAEAYGPEALVTAMIQHRYDLQYQLYTLALHRYLASRLPDYDYERHVGGVFYLFLRGMQAGGSQGVFATRPSQDFIRELDRLFAGEVTP